MTGTAFGKIKASSSGSYRKTINKRALLFFTFTRYESMYLLSLRRLMIGAVCTRSGQRSASLNGFCFDPVFFITNALSIFPSYLITGVIRALWSF